MFIPVKSSGGAIWRPVEYPVDRTIPTLLVLPIKISEPIDTVAQFSKEHGYNTLYLPERTRGLTCTWKKLLVSILKRALSGPLRE